MPQTFSLTDNPASINYIEFNLNRADGPLQTSIATDSDNWATLKQSDDVFAGNRKYLIIVNARVGGPNANLVSSFRVTQDHDGSEITPTMSIEPGAYNRAKTYACAEIFTPPVDTKINFQARAHDGSSWAKIYYFRIVALDITDLREGLDYFHSTDSTALIHTNLYVNRNEYTIDDDSTGVSSEQIIEEGDGFSQACGEWLILGTALMDVNSTHNDSYSIKMKSGHGEYHRGDLTYTLPPRQLFKEEGEDADERAVLFSVYKELVTKGPSDTQIAFRARISTGDPISDANPNEYISSTLIGLNMSRFKDIQTGYELASRTSTSSSEETLETWSQKSSNDGKAFIIACGAYDCQATNRTCWTGIDQDAVDVFDLGTGYTPNDQAICGYSNDGTDEYAFIAMGLVDIKLGITHEYKWQFNKFTTSETETEDRSYSMFSLTYNYEDFYDDKVDIIKIGEVRRRRSSPTIPTIG